MQHLTVETTNDVFVRFSFVIACVLSSDRSQVQGQPPLDRTELAASTKTSIDDPLFPPLGPVRGARVSLGQHFLPKLSELVAGGVLRPPPMQDDPRPSLAA